ncbi:uncharacterized protein [Drosophila bipectinata]|uniref:uncharacterized protein n=1 Tax=Drosophila bipectinata TaxID=42026 RepID=UPI001C897566|nr:uncharacterized protein LOC122321000 [Drosophila bipectinata]
MGSFHKAEYKDLEEGLLSIAKVVVRYQTDLDRRVRFEKLQEAIDEVHEHVGPNYEGSARKKMDKLDVLSRTALSHYQEGIGLVFVWCSMARKKFQIVLNHISGNPTKEDMDIAWSVTVNALQDGLKRTLKSLELLRDSHLKVCQAKDLLDSIQHDLYDDFGPNGVYGKRKKALQVSKEQEESHNTAFRATLITVAIIPIVGLLSLTGLGALDESNQRIRSYERKLIAIHTLFQRSQEAVENGSRVVKNGLDLQLDEEIKHLRVLRGTIDSAHQNGALLKSESPLIRALFVPVLENLREQCHNYTKWHGSME